MGAGFNWLAQGISVGRNVMIMELKLLDIKWETFWPYECLIFGVTSSSFFVHSGLQFLVHICENEDFRLCNTWCCSGLP